MAEKDRGVKFCMRVGLLSGQVFSPLGEHWLAGSHGGGGICTVHSSRDGSGGNANCGQGRWAFRIGAVALVGFGSCKPADALVCLFCVVVFFI